VPDFASRLTKAVVLGSHYRRKVSSVLKRCEDFVNSRGLTRVGYDRARVQAWISVNVVPQRAESLSDSVRDDRGPEYRALRRLVKRHSDLRQREHRVAIQTALSAVRMSIAVCEMSGDGDARWRRDDPRLLGGRRVVKRRRFK
jgi:hypothetical protein